MVASSGNARLASAMTSTMSVTTQRKEKLAPDQKKGK